MPRDLTDIYWEGHRPCSRMRRRSYCAVHWQSAWLPESSALKRNWTQEIKLQRAKKRKLEIWGEDREGEHSVSTSSYFHEKIYWIKKFKFEPFCVLFFPGHIKFWCGYFTEAILWLFSAFWLSNNGKNRAFSLQLEPHSHLLEMRS